MVREIQSGNPAYAEFLREKGELIGKVLFVLIDLFNPQQVFMALQGAAGAVDYSVSGILAGEWEW